jgi:hypothetical protein
MENQLNIILQKWKLPKEYIEFLKKNEKDKIIEGDQFMNDLCLYGMKNLVKHQEGYSYDPLEKKEIKDWPSNYIVIADDSADPFVLDLTNSEDNDCPVLYAMHGAGEWEFEKYAESFDQFIEQINDENYNEGDFIFEESQDSVENDPNIVTEDSVYTFLFELFSYYFGSYSRKDSVFQLAKAINENVENEIMWEDAINIVKDKKLKKKEAQLISKVITGEKELLDEENSYKTILKLIAEIETEREKRN